jgi:hypothetical protein
LTTREGQKTNRTTPEDKLITRGPTEHQRITSHLLVKVEQIGVVIPELVDLERAVMEDDGVFFFQLCEFFPGGRMWTLANFFSSRAVIIETPTNIFDY